MIPVTAEVYGHACKDCNKKKALRDKQASLFQVSWGCKLQGYKHRHGCK